MVVTVPAAIALLAALLPLQTKVPKPYDQITPESLQAHLRFLSSDLLEGRGTPSRGLDIAAEYIAAQFKLAGLATPPNGEGMDGYFQVTEFENRRTKLKAPVRNVIGVLPGSDPKLKGTYVIVTGHYDHLGKRDGEGDQIFNGANDDGSGTVGVIESARALAGLKPKRTIVFMCFWGEEAGLQGSRYYTQHPVFPLLDTVVDVNLEQIGRTDDDEGPRVSEFNLTGFDYTDLAATMTKAATPFGVKVTMHPKFSGPYFFASDNAPFATAGVPANTISTSYSFPDYHKVGDEWQKVDFVNMAKIVRSVCAGVWSLANSKDDVKWNEKNEKTKRYVDAWKKLHGAS
ncbi:MAG: M20/M25/M40 family metallo-hydrolase [Armatimonadetes bacterium]|nr:M20/M25/M40 family metallo-hydrolase [Armatimonadota bacterium]